MYLFVSENRGKSSFYGLFDLDKNSAPSNPKNVVLKYSFQILMFGL